MFDPEAFGAAMGDLIREACAPLHAKIKELEARVSVAGTLIDRDGALVVTYSNGETKSLGPVVGSNGKDGKDGADFTDAEIDFDGERGLIIRGKGGEIRKRLSIPMDKGYWREGLAVQKADIVTQDGSAWIALRDTTEPPSHQAKEDWRLFARKGKDGERGARGTVHSDAPISLVK
jgi:hypothetical protein